MKLSIREAAREVPEGVGLIFENERLDFAALADRVEARLPTLASCDPHRPFPVVASPTLEAFVTLYACLEARIPVGLIDPRWPGPVQAAQRERLASVQAGGGAGDRAPLAFLFTSGTTGQSKLIELSRAAFLTAEQAHALSCGWRPDDRWLLVLPFAHVGGLSVLTRSLIARKPVVVFGDRPFDALAILDLIERTQTTIVSLVPAQLERLVEATPKPPRSLRTVLLGGAAASPAQLSLAAAAGWPVLPCYGMTETCAQIATGVPGVALAGVELRIAEGSGGGMLEVRSPTLLTAYHDGEGSFSPLDGDGWFRTGDLGALDTQGRLSVLGRADDVIVTGGEKVHPLDVERMLEQVPGVTAACVVGLPDPTWGQIVAAALVADPPPSPDLLRARATVALAKFQRPRRWLFVDALPRNAAGKLDRRAVIELLTRPSAD